MKLKRTIQFLFVLSIIGANSQAQQHEHVFDSEQEQSFLDEMQEGGQFEGFGFRFEQTRWNECSEDPSGNYVSAGCVSSRGISVILKDFLQDHLYSCVDEGLRAQGGGRARDVHIVHTGILGDPRHSPRSLHAESRAIDVKGFVVSQSFGRQTTISYSSSNRPFYRAFRACWGRVIRRYNRCPYYNGDASLTGTIGWEDRNHQNHMHLSVPHCVFGQYGDYYYKR